MRTVRITTAVVAVLPRSVYCGVLHPLFHRRKVTFDDLANHPFVAPPAQPGGAIGDGWPAERPRRVGMFVDQIRVGLELCAALPMLAVLPDVLARRRRGELRRLPIAGIAPGSVYALHRRTLGRKRSLAGELVHRIQAAQSTATRPAP
ncbi:MAG: LysR substrate-binding domain-containing protein [Planctomycetota bacterium]